MNDITRFEKLIAGRGECKIESPEKLKKDIIFLCNFNIKTTAATAFVSGAYLKELKAKIEHGKFLAFLEKEFPLSQRTAYRYMKLHEHFKDDPSAMEKIGLRQALIWAGIIKPKERKKIPLLPDEHYGDKKGAIDLLHLFKEPPLNEDAKLDRHRLYITGNTISVIEKYYSNLPVPITTIYMPGEEDSRLSRSFRGMMEGIQKLMEKYFEKLELFLKDDERVLKNSGIRPCKKPGTGAGKKLNVRGGGGE